MSEEQNFKLFSGEDKTLRFTVYQVDGETVEPLTGWSLDATFRPEVEGSVPILTKAAVVTDGPLGKCEVELTRAETLAWAPYDRLVVALRRTNAGASTVVVDGVVTIDDP